MNRRSTHHAPDWTPMQTGWFIASLIALGTTLAFALLRMVGFA